MKSKFYIDKPSTITQPKNNSCNKIGEFIAIMFKEVIENVINKFYLK